MFSSSIKLLRIAITGHRAFGSKAGKSNLPEYHIYSYPEVTKQHFSYFNIQDCREIKSGRGWKDYRDVNNIEFRMAVYQHPPKGFVSVCINGSNTIDPENLDIAMVDSTTAAVKRSHTGILLNSCVMYLGCTDALTAEAEAAHLGLFISEDDEKVRLYLDSKELIKFLNSLKPAPSECLRDLIHEMKSIMLGKVRNGGTVEVVWHDMIANLLPDRLARQPLRDRLRYPLNTPVFFALKKNCQLQKRKEFYKKTYGGFQGMQRKINRVTV